jgi:tetratricopeptide (TPR) repeat protein
MLREIVDKTAARIDRDLNDQPDVQIELRLTLANAYFDLQLFKKAEATARETLRLARANIGEENLSVADSLSQLGFALYFLRAFDEAELCTREAIALQRKLRGNDSMEEASELQCLCDVLRRKGKLEESETAIRACLVIRRKRLGNENDRVASALNTLSILLRTRNKLADAEAASRESVAIEKKLVGEEHPAFASSLMWLGNVLRFSDDKLNEAEICLRKSIAIARKTEGNGAWFQAWTLYFLADVLTKKKNLEEAEIYSREALEIARKQMGDDHPDIPDFIAQLANLLSQNGKLDQARALAKETETMKWRKAAESGDASALNEVAWLLAISSDPNLRDGTNAVIFADRAVAMTRRTNEAYLDTLAAGYAENGDFAKAISVQKEAMGLLRDEPSKKDFASRLKLYESGSPYRIGSEKFAEKYSYTGGYFGKTGQAKWIEGKTDSSAAFYFEEIKRDGEIILLKDTGRNFSIRIPIRGGISELSTDDGRHWRNLYEVTKE